MNRRPWPIVILAALQLLTPLINALINSWLLQVPLLDYLKGFLNHQYLPNLVVLLLVPIASAVFIYACKLWGLVGFVTLEMALFGWNVMQRAADPDHYSLFILAATTAANLALVLYFLVPAVRQFYTNASLRWWETKPRYLKQLNVSVTTQTGPTQKSTAQTVNISEGGAFVKTTLSLTPQQLLTFELKDDTHEFTTTAEVMHIASEHGLAGLKFNTPDRKTAKLIRNYIAHIKAQGIPERNPPEPWQSSFISWVKELRQPHKALIPQIPDEIKNYGKKRA